MKVIKFEQNNCKKFQAYLDLYLNNELLIETAHDVSLHLENCPNCYEALLARQQMKERLKSAVLKDSVPTDLAEKIRRSIHKDSSTKWTGWMLVAAATIALIAAGSGALQLFNRGTPARSDANSTASPANAQLLKIGLDDHVHCALDMGLANRVFTEEEMLE